MHAVRGFRVELTNNRPALASAMVLERLDDALDASHRAGRTCTAAASVLHEGMHARTFCLARAMAGTQPAREERICRRAELAFGRALPAEEGAPVIARAQEALELGDFDVAPRFTEAEGMAAVERADAATRAAAPPRDRAATP